MTFWEQKLAQIKWLLVADDIKNFMEWAPLQQTMIVGNAGYIANMIDETIFNYKVDNLLKEPDFITKKYFYPGTTWLPNSIVQLFHLNYLEYVQDKIIIANGCGVNHLDSIFEFGGGIGSMCRLIKQLGFKGKYIIYDFPEIIEIQKFYLGECNLLENVEFYSNMGDLFFDYSNVDLFIAHQSLSETDKETRAIFIHNMNAKHYFVSFAKQWENMDNLEYFKKNGFHVESMPYVGNNVYYGVK